MTFLTDICFSFSFHEFLLWGSFSPSDQDSGVLCLNHISLMLFPLPSCNPWRCPKCKILPEVLFQQFFIKNSFTCMDLPHCHSKPNCEPSSASLLGFRLLCPVDCGPSLLKTQQHLFTFNTQNQIIIPYQRYFPFLLYPLDIR